MSWWEQTDSGQVPVVRQPIKCPVCQATLAYRYPDDRMWAHCEECKADFYFAPNKDIPTRATPDSLKCGSKKCGCGRCGK